MSGSVTAYNELHLAAHLVLRLTIHTVFLSVGFLVRLPASCLRFDKHVAMKSNVPRNVGPSGMRQACAKDEHITNSKPNLKGASRAIVSFSCVWKMSPRLDSKYGSVVLQHHDYPQILRRRCCPCEKLAGL
jgi:hypothetical protein